MTKGARLKVLRQSANLTQEQLAVIIGTTKQTIYKYENDIITNIPIDKLEAICISLHTSPAIIMGWNEEKKPAPTDEDELDAALIKMLGQLTPAEYQRMQDFVAGMIASRKDGASPKG